jgi:hypothetical protein
VIRGIAGKDRRGDVGEIAGGGRSNGLGFCFYGIATSTYEHYDRVGDLGVYLMIGGVIAAVVGLFWYRSQERGLR